MFILTVCYLVSPSQSVNQSALSGYQLVGLSAPQSVEEPAFETLVVPALSTQLI